MNVLEDQLIQFLEMRDFHIEVFELAFGDDAINKDYSYDDVIKRLREMIVEENDALRLTNDLAWNEAEELHCSLSTLSFAEIEECHDSLVARAEKIMKLLGESDDE